MAYKGISWKSCLLQQLFHDEAASHSRSLQVTRDCKCFGLTTFRERVTVAHHSSQLKLKKNRKKYHLNIKTHCIKEDWETTGDSAGKDTRQNTNWCTTLKWQHTINNYTHPHSTPCSPSKLSIFLWTGAMPFSAASDCDITINISKTVQKSCSASCSKKRSPHSIKLNIAWFHQEGKPTTWVLKLHFDINMLLKTWIQQRGATSSVYFNCLKQLRKRMLLKRNYKESLAVNRVLIFTLNCISFKIFGFIIYLSKPNCWKKHSESCSVIKDDHDSSLCCNCNINPKNAWGPHLWFFFLLLETQNIPDNGLQTS